MKRLLFVCLIGIICLPVYAQITNSAQPSKFISSANWVQAKNYYLLTLFEQDKIVNQLLKKDAELTKITQKKLKDLNNSIVECKDAACFIDRVKFTDDEIKTVSAELTELCKPG
ncbi:MAG TPA: YdcF family protein, partial [Mucilaginibacter sp.]